MASQEQQGKQSSWAEEWPELKAYPEEQIRIALEDFREFALRILRGGALAANEAPKAFPRRPLLPLDELPEHTPESGLQELSMSKYADILLFVIAHPQTPEATILSLAQDNREAEVRQAALERLKGIGNLKNHLPAFVKSSYADLQLLVLSHPGTRAEQISALVSSRHEEVQRKVVEHPLLEAADCAQLASAGLTPSVRSAALERFLASSQPIEGLLILTQSKFEEVLAALVRPSIPDEILLEIIKGRRFAKPADAALEMMLGERASPEALAIMASFTHDDVVWKVAFHPLTPPACYTVLAGGLGRALQNITKAEQTSREEWVQEEYTDNYGNTTSSGSGHYETVYDTNQVPDIERLNDLVKRLPAALRQEARRFSGDLKNNTALVWDAPETSQDVTAP
jgi:hypothetical protein